MDHTNTKIFVRNNADHVIKIPKHYQLDCITKVPYESQFIISKDNAAFILPVLPIMFYYYNDISILLAKNLEMELANGINIYRNEKTINAITCLVNKYLFIWEFPEFEQIPLKRWMKVYLKLRSKTKVLAMKQRAYLLVIKAKHLVDQTFDEIQCFY